MHVASYLSTNRAGFQSFARKKQMKLLIPSKLLTPPISIFLAESYACCKLFEHEACRFLIFLTEETNELLIPSKLLIPPISIFLAESYACYKLFEHESCRFLIFLTEKIKGPFGPFQTSHPSYIHLFNRKVDMLHVV